ncbi:TA system antitoxin ParD family protein [Aeromonas sanarellii]
MPQFKLRIDDDLHAAIKLSSEHNNRSVNSEIAHHLRNAMEAAGYIGLPATEQADVTAPSSPKRWVKKEKVTIQTDMPDEAMQELMFRIQEVWDKYKAKQDQGK